MKVDQMINDIITITDPNAPASEAYRTLRTNITMRDFDHKIKVINVVSSRFQEGKSTTIVNLGVVYAQLNKKVLIIDMDLRIPTIHKKLKIRNKVGLTNLVADQASKNDTIIKYATNLDVITSGSKIPFASEFVQSQALRTLIDSLKDDYDIILIDCPPIGVVSDGTIISSFCDGTLLVVAHNQNEKKDLIRVKAHIDEMNVNLLGVVMTRMPVTKGYYSYAYRYEGKREETKKKINFFGDK